jgi:hypothetical protein
VHANDKQRIGQTLARLLMRLILARACLELYAVKFLIIPILQKRNPTIEPVDGTGYLDGNIFQTYGLRSSYI